MHLCPAGRGGGAQFLHISELGPKSLRDPIGARNQSGSINTVPVGGKVFIESTHGGGRFGMFYEFMELASKFSADGAAIGLEDGVLWVGLGRQEQH